MAKYVVGGADLQKRLNKLSQLEQNKVVRKALRRGAKAALQAEYAVTPVVTGVMRGQLRVRAMKRSRKGFGYTSRSIVREGQRYYAAFVLYGAQGRPPRRFWNNAVDAAADPILLGVISAIKSELDKLGV